VKTIAATAIAATVCACLAAPAGAVIPKPWKNCAQVNARYPHGVGKPKAHDHTSDDPVTTFLRSKKLYTTAIGYNRGLDRDHDGIACEQA
jgi:hypothetical protein